MLIALIADTRPIRRNVARVDCVMPVRTDVCVEDREQTAKAPQLFSDAGPQGPQSTAVAPDEGVALVEDPRPRGGGGTHTYSAPTLTPWYGSNTRRDRGARRGVEGEAKFPESGKLDADGALDAVDLETWCT